MRTFTLSRFMLSAVAVLSLAACASVVDTPNQRITIVTPGAKDVRCVLASQYVRYVAYPPMPLFIRRMQEPLTVTCQAPGNREKTIMLYPTLNKTAVGNVATAGAGAVYDQISGALYEYPEHVTVDFTNVRASSIGLPAYHNADTVSPFDQVNEDMRERGPENPEDQGLIKKAPAKTKNLISKEEQTLAPYKSDIQRPY